MTDKKKKILLGSVVAGCGLAIAAAAVVAVTDTVVKVAISRNMPKIVPKVDFKKYADSPMLSKFLDDRASAAQALSLKDNQEIQITAKDGTELVGHLIPAESPKRIVLAMHGWRSDWCSDFGIISNYLSQSGCTVLYVEQRGQNKSSGDYMGFGITERFDCIDWVNWINLNINQSNNLPIYLFGISMGATTVLMSTALDLPNNVCGVIADCGFTSPKAIWKHVTVSNLHLDPHIHLPIANKMFQKRLNVESSGYSAEHALKSNKIPVFFAHGTDDRFVPVNMTFSNYKACTSKKILFVVPGADHGMSYYCDTDNYEAALNKFFDDYDATPERNIII